ncbi:MAG: hypothetical protein LBR38_06675 [Synergistaceae bacterium]|jgi:hypothetical protein|nr:hypothetical protein [Synergistaceae bacterium]
MDALWKEILTSMTFSALEVFYPTLYAELDTGGQRKPRFRTPELLVPGMCGGKGIVALAIRTTPKKKGEETAYDEGIAELGNGRMLNALKKDVSYFFEEGS